ncbi:hypothetical protein ACFWHR_07755 [Leucobacter sp. NPDC058333]|uniref:hypothetical protein n=1 Tax=Leucobacter sp. NPDC058333 TaxID=3346450 RepID=UPI0036698C5A
MSRATLPLRVLGALSMGWPMPEEHDGLPVAWSFDLAPGDNDGIDEPHFSIELWTLGGTVIASFSERSIEAVHSISACTLRPKQIATVIEQWEALYAWPYNGELDEVAA